MCLRMQLQGSTAEAPPACLAFSGLVHYEGGELRSPSEMAAYYAANPSHPWTTSGEGAFCQALRRRAPQHCPQCRLAAGRCRRDQRIELVQLVLPQ